MTLRLLFFCCFQFSERGFTQVIASLGRKKGEEERKWWL